MTFVIDQKHINNYYVSYEFEDNCYAVRVCPKYDCGCGYPIRERFYKDEKNAKRTYRRYIKEFENE